VLLPVILLGAALLGGVTILTLRAQGGNPPVPLAVAHGFFVLLGLGSLPLAVKPEDWSGTLGVAAGTLVVASLLGFVMFFGHVKGRLISMTLATVHGMIAVVGYALLLVHAFR
jgi:hypothetical protein